ncbi:hypothetical protein NEOLI_006021 (mitochondrion) [Neolecta irregularis DAH-3]|uniref:Uncharacterized protein n=1 Tax=Neolecta irregularis (strain DAH-3) TaxID=1198029 RepID=A0A1U7LG56_NEOID|nr:hypothetical protein NEOLI_006021 [Neolecta irregularis DAH-3]|eukprot:OLL21608.1 hypothetical protein NEOLI_006021 (mitochondrion) [Neolecta irregularis DAH-3]
MVFPTRNDRFLLFLTALNSYVSRGTLKYPAIEPILTTNLPTLPKIKIFCNDSPPPHVVRGGETLEDGWLSGAVDSEGCFHVSIKVWGGGIPPPPSNLPPTLHPFGVGGGWKILKLVSKYYLRFHKRGLKIRGF